MSRTARLSLVPREARLFQGHRAGIVTRALAALIDAALVAVAALVTGYLAWAGAGFAGRATSLHVPGGVGLLSIAAALALLTVYLALAWAISGRTSGAIVLGLRVVGRDGHRLRLWVALARAALSCPGAPSACCGSP